MGSFDQLQQRYEQFQQQQLNLNLTRGKPSSEQIDLCSALDGILQGDYRSEDGTDTRNYGGLYGITEARELGSCLLDIPSERVIAGGNSSLQLMFIALAQLLRHGIAGPALHSQGAVKAICPVPGYDRHFSVCEHLGIQMCAVPMDDNGPDMDVVEDLVRNDRSINMMWCVPKNSNPSGCTFSEATVDRMVALPNLRNEYPESPFYVFSDNAYAVHDFEDAVRPLANIDERARFHGTEDRIVQFASTSKITFAGGGVAFVGGSSKVLVSFADALNAMTVGNDKVNQLRHARFLRNGAGLADHMQKLAQILRPKFRCVQAILERELGMLDIASWTQPTGGYFVSLDVLPGTARKIVATAKAAGLALTPAGATFPYGDDPNDTNIRIAPTFATLPQVEIAVELLSICVKLVAAQKQAYEC